jgi:hypothetical protein
MTLLLSSLFDHLLPLIATELSHSLLTNQFSAFGVVQPSIGLGRNELPWSRHIGNW